jgi:hypothetical protein
MEGGGGLGLVFGGGVGEDTEAVPTEANNASVNAFDFGGGLICCFAFGDALPLDVSLPASSSSSSLSGLAKPEKPVLE